MLLPSIVLLIIAQLWVHSTVAEDDDNHQLGVESSLTSTNLNLRIEPVPKWPNKKIRLGQVSGVAVDTYGNVYVFHRGPRVWDTFAFDRNDVFVSHRTPIAEPTVAVIHPSSGELLHAWGKQMFYLPHGITVDSNNYVWVTDVAMHQIFKFPSIVDSKINNTAPLLKMGSLLRPGNDKYTFCKPTSIAVEASGRFFVADGYCNARVIKYDADGIFLTQWGRSSLSTGPLAPNYHFDIPHDLSLAEDKNLLFVSDRENGRIQCFMASNGSFLYPIQSHDFGSRLFSASYTPANDGLLFIVNGPGLRNSEMVHGSVVSTSGDMKVLTTFQPQANDEPTFRKPHDVIVTPNGSSLYVAELKPFRVWKFNVVGLRSSAPMVMERIMDDGNSEKRSDARSSGTMLMAIFITAIVLCFGAVLLTMALVYSRTRTRGGCSGHCKQPAWLVGRSTVEGFKLGSFLGQQNQGFVKLNNFEESDEDDANVSPTSFA